ncbi:Fanconi anemia group I protein [Achroia grisella]|uniref:Fanconi anemia group I protein n=1 Tax=Achroia grisella TaxID=688607 RepID=UPI0027D2B33B|nr:Fanconi anemia group I protein [Achroia grisella]
MDIVFTKIKELGHVNSKRDELRDYCKVKIEQVLSVLDRRILSSDAANLLDCLFNGLSDNCSTSFRNKVKVIGIVLQTMRKETTSTMHCSDVISRLCLELGRMPAEDLVKWCDNSVQSIVENADVNMIWRDVLPECLNVLASHINIKHCGTDMTITEYKEQCVRTLCQCRWREKQLVQLTAMFKDMQLNRNDHKQVVNKLCSYITDVPPESLPPLLHQLLKLCKTYNVEIVLAQLSHYFSVRLYSKLEPPPQDSESTTMDIDDIVRYNPLDLSRCLSTCIYHITQGAAESETIRKHLKAWPKTQLLRAPFLIDLALAISDKGPDFKTVCLDVIKSAIEHRIIDELRSKESAWSRSVLPPDVDVPHMLKVLTTESVNHSQLTVMGLINVAFLLLAVSRLKPIAQTCWSHGKLILVRLSKSQPETAPHILTQLADRLAGDTSQRQYADCLHVLCKLTPVSVERCSQLFTILENCQPAGGDYRAAAAVLDAVHPLLNFSLRTRDTLIMVCRKGLYSRDSVHRCLSLSGLLSVLEHIRVSRRTFSSSQSASSEHYSTHSYLTQLTVDLHATQLGAAVTSRVRNEAMCMEVVSILRRCLVQDVAVKQLLFNKLYVCAKEKTALHETILETLYEHISKYLPESNDEGSPLLLYKCVQVTDTGANLVEPISHLLYVIAEFVQPVEDEELEDILGSQNAETGSAHLKNKLIHIMDKLCRSETLGAIDLQDPGLSDLTPESKAKSLKVQQILQCYETLIAYKILQWVPTSTDAAKSVYSLYKSCNQLLEQLKAPPKTGKKGNKSLNETRETVKSQKSQKSQKKGKAPVKLSNLTKDKAGPFKPLPCLWHPGLCQRIIELLYNESVPWSSLEQSNYIRGRRDFHRWALRCILSVLTCDHMEKRYVTCNVTKIAAVIYRRCISRFQDMCDFDDQTTLSCLEVFKACLTLLFSSNYSLQMDGFLSKITGIPDVTASTHIAVILENLLLALQQAEAESEQEESDAVAKKIVAMLVQTAGLLLDVPVPHLAEMTNMLIKLEEYIRTSKQDWLPMLPALLAAGYRDQQEAQILDELLLKVAEVLGRIDEEDTSAGEESTNFPLVDSKSGHTVLAHVCSHLGLRFRCVDHLLQRTRDLTTAVTLATESHQQRIERELNELYKCIILQLCSLTTWVSRCCKLRCSPGAGSDRVLAVAVRLFSLLATLARHLPPTVAQHLRFERLLKLCGKKFSTVTDNLITYLEGSQQQQNASKVLRDTKLIPRLVLEAEQFSKHVILLANKGNLNYQQYLSLGTARDFRIKAPVLQEALNAREEPEVDDNSDNDEQIDINDAATEILGSGSDHDGNVDDNSRRKKKRVSKVLKDEQIDISDAATDILGSDHDGSDEDNSRKKKKRLS